MIPGAYPTPPINFFDQNAIDLTYLAKVLILLRKAQSYLLFRRFFFHVFREEKSFF